MPQIYFSIAIYSLIILPICHIAILRLFREKYSEYVYIVFILTVHVICITLKYKNILYSGISNYLTFIVIYFTVFLLYFELYVFLRRGFTFTILTSIYTVKSITLNDLIDNYCGGKGFEWLINKRIETLDQYGLIDVNCNTLLIKPKMMRIYRILKIVRTILNINYKG